MEKLKENIFFVLILIFYLIFISYHYTPSYINEDSFGYFHMARKLINFDLPLIKNSDFFRFHEHYWVQNWRGEIYPKFFIGLPVLQSVFITFFGEDGFFLLSPTMGFLALVGFYFFLSIHFNRLITILGVTLLATNPLFLSYANYPNTHIPTLALNVFVMLLLSKMEHRPTTLLSIFLGICVSFLTLTHLTSLLLFLSAIPLFLILFKQGKFKEILLPFFLTSLGFVIILLFYNYKTSGDAFLTGYGLSGDQQGLSLSYIAENLKYLATGFVPNFFPLLPLALIGLCSKSNRRIQNLLHFFPFFLFYLCYYYGRPSIAYYRFFIILLPIWVYGVLVFFSKLQEKQNYYRAFIFSLFIFCFIFQIHGANLWSTAIVSSPEKKMMKNISDWTEQSLNANSVIYSTYPFLYYLGNLKNFQVIDLRAFDQSKVQDWLAPSEKAPRSQSARLDQLRLFYSTKTQVSLQEELVLHIKNHLEQAYPVLYLSPDLPSTELLPFKRKSVNHWQYNDQTWTIWELSL